MLLKFMPDVFYQQKCKSVGFCIMASTSFRLITFPLYAERNITTNELTNSMEENPIFRE